MASLEDQSSKPQLGSWQDDWGRKEVPSCASHWHCAFNSAEAWDLLSMELCPPNLCDEALIPSGTILGDRAHKEIIRVG